VNRVIRDTFAVPVIDTHSSENPKALVHRPGIHLKKGGLLLRAGLHLLARISAADLAQAMASVKSVRTGRPPAKKRRRKSHQDNGKTQ
jgi:hypothetical protein